MARDGAIETIIAQMSLAFAPEIGLSLGTPQYSPSTSQSNFILPVLSPNVHTHVQLRSTKAVKCVRSFSLPPFIISVYFIFVN